MGDLLNKAKEKLQGSDKDSDSLSRSRSSGHSKTRDRVIPPEPVQQQTEGDFSQNDNQIPLQLHNVARASKRCNKLEWDFDLAHDAEAYAKVLATAGELKHSNVEGQGENLFMGTSDAAFEDAVDSWLNEEKKYNGENIGEGNLSDFGDFTQCVWYNTTHFGMGKAQSKSGKTFIVGRYTPRGNVEGERPFKP